MSRKTKINCTVKVKTELIANYVHTNNSAFIDYYAGYLVVKIGKVKIVKEYYLPASHEEAIKEMNKIHDKYVKDLQS